MYSLFKIFSFLFPFMYIYVYNIYLCVCGYKTVIRAYNELILKTLICKAASLYLTIYIYENKQN